MLSSKYLKASSSALVFALFLLIFTAGCNDTPVQSIDQEESIAQVYDVEQDGDAALNATLDEESRHHRVGPPAFVGNRGNKGHARSRTTENIVEIASGNPDFSILVQAVVFAGLDGVLSSRRQLTVFAPTNAAFEALLADLGLTPSQLLAPGNEDLVRSILLYHVAPGKRFAKTIAKPHKRVNTLQKEFLRVKLDNGNVIIGNNTNGYANIVATDIFATNGVVHVIDAVLLQPSFSL